MHGITPAVHFSSGVMPCIYDGITPEDAVGLTNKTSLIPQCFFASAKHFDMVKYSMGCIAESVWCCMAMMIDSWQFDCCIAWLVQPVRLHQPTDLAFYPSRVAFQIILHQVTAVPNNAPLYAYGTNICLLFGMYNSLHAVVQCNRVQTRLIILFWTTS